MINWHKELYMDDIVAADLERYKQCVEAGTVRAMPVYIVTKPSNDSNIMDIISGNELVFEHYKRITLEVIGIAASYRGAVSIVKSIAVKAYDKDNIEGFNEIIREIVS